MFRLVWPSQTWMLRVSAPFRMSRVAAAWRIECCLISVLPFGPAIALMSSAERCRRSVQLPMEAFARGRKENRETALGCCHGCGNTLCPDADREAGPRIPGREVEEVAVGGEAVKRLTSP